MDKYVTCIKKTSNNSITARVNFGFGFGSGSSTFVLSPYPSLYYTPLPAFLILLPLCKNNRNRSKNHIFGEIETATQKILFTRTAVDLGNFDESELVFI